MKRHTNLTPTNYKGVMVSSTFADLAQHRVELMKALRKEELFTIGMEKCLPSPHPGEDVISASLNMVRKSSKILGVGPRQVIDIT